MDNVVYFTGETRLDLDVDRTLDNTKGKLTGYVLAGYDKDGNYFFSTTYADDKKALWLTKKLESALLSKG